MTMARRKEIAARSIFFVIPIFMVITFELSRISFNCDGGILALRLEDDEARRVLRKYVQIDSYACKQLSSVAEVAKRYGFTEKKVRCWFDEGCPFYRVSTDIRLDDREVDEWFSTRFGRNKEPGSKPK
jgi:hypothetical protein